MSTRMSRKLSLMMICGLVAVLAGVATPVVAQDEACQPENTALRKNAPAFALHGNYWTGTREFKLDAPPDDYRTTRSIGMLVTAWYPALNPDCAVEHIEYPLDALMVSDVYQLTYTVAGRAILDAAPDTENGPYPLVILSHGLQGHRLMYHYIAEHLASHGFFVLAASHEDNLVVGTYFHLSLVSRPADVTRLIDFAEVLTAPDGEMAGMIDVEKVAVGGHSFGGYTALTVAGARLDYRAIRASNEAEPNAVDTQLISYERDVAARAGLAEPPDGPFPSWQDSRVDAVVAMAPPAQNWLGVDSAALVTMPTLMLYGSADSLYSVNMPFYANLGASEKALVVFENGSHGLFAYTCWTSPDYVAGTGCVEDDVWAIDRVHDLINHYIAAFLLTELNDFRPSSVYLQAEDADAFPGVVVESTIQVRQRQ